MNKKVKALVLGSTGLLGQILTEQLKIYPNFSILSPTKQELDVLNFINLKEYINDLQPDYIFNSVGYTQVDKAEDEKKEALILNHSLPNNLGQLIKNTNIFLIHYSTDFVFNGATEKAYTISDKTDPLSSYGQSKLAGETALLSLNINNFSIIRTAWLFGPYKKNFVSTILNLAKEREILPIVHDQTGSPTYTVDLAGHSIKLALTRTSGVFHIVNQGQATWCELATEAVRLAGINCQVKAISSEQYPQKAKRPTYAVLDTSNFIAITNEKPRTWTRALAEYISVYKPHI